MSKDKHTQIIAALKQVEAGRTTQDVARELGGFKHTIYARAGQLQAAYVYTPVDAAVAGQLRDTNVSAAILSGPPVHDMNAGAPLESAQLSAVLLNGPAGDAAVRTVIGVAIFTVE